MVIRFSSPSCSGISISSDFPRAYLRPQKSIGARVLVEIDDVLTQSRFVYEDQHRHVARKCLCSFTVRTTHRSILGEGIIRALNGTVTEVLRSLSCIFHLLDVPIVQESLLF